MSISFEQVLLLFLPVNFIGIALFWRYFYKDIKLNKGKNFYVLPLVFGLLSPVISFTITLFLQYLTKSLFIENMLLLIDFVIMIPFIEEVSKAYVIHLINKYY